MYELKVSDKVTSQIFGHGEVVGILTRFPAETIGPVVIMRDNGYLAYSGIHGEMHAPSAYFTKIPEKKKIKLFLNIYNPINGRPLMYTYTTAEKAMAIAGPDAIGAAVPFEYEYEVKEDN